VALYIGIGTALPVNKLDVVGKISLSQSPTDEMVIINDDQWNHSSGLQDFGDGGDTWIIASKEGSGESAGIYGDGDHVTIWSPGDGAPGQPPALLYVLDEDGFGDADGDPFNNNALRAFLDPAGNWVAASDRRQKTNIEPMQGSLERLLQINGYQYQFIRNADDIKDDRAAPTHYGVLAQELESVFPAAVQRSDAGDYYVSYTALIPAFIEAIREQQGTIEQLNAQNAELADRLAAIEARLNGSSGN